MEFRLFGEVAVLATGLPLDLGTPRQRAVLAALLVDAGRPVAIDTLIDRVWGDDPPVEARKVLYSHVSRIRQVLRKAGADPQEVERRQAGYVLSVDHDRVDLLRFARLVDRGRDPRRPDTERARALDEALVVWRGTPLAAVAGEWAERVRRSWHQRRIDAAVHWARAELRLGDAAAVIARLPDLADEYPLTEPLECALMEALHAAGRDAEAIDRYAAVRRRIADELGTEPGVELRTLHSGLLRGDLAPARCPAPPARRGHAAPAQLPPDVRGFAGREAELRQLDAASVGAATVMISAVDGTAGVGKTALAVHWAHRVAHRFGDGQLYVDLQGFDPAGSPLTPGEVVRRFLAAFGTPPDRVPPDLEAQIGLYRSVLAGRRVLVVLDNARDAAQVRPLLPGAPGCMVVVTSRNRLVGLVAATGARPLTLDLLPATDARDLLARRVGADRVAAEPDAVADIIAACARLPLALSVVAARATMHPHFGLAALAGELDRARGSLEEFAGTDPATNARAVFSWSYRQLTDGAARLFRLLGLHPGPDVATPAAAGMAELSVARVRPLLAELTGAHLLAEHAPGRYTCHDLLRVYAAEQAARVDPEAERRGAVLRAFAHYTSHADAADRLLSPHRDGPTTSPDVPGPAPVADRAEALAWFHAEHPVLVRFIRHRSGFDAHTCHLAWMLTRYLSYQGRWQDSITVLEAARDAAERLADAHGLAYAHRMTGCAHVRLGRFEEAHRHLREAIERYRGIGDLSGEAHAERHYAWLLERQHRYRDALPHARRAYELFRAADHRHGIGRALNAIGWFQAVLDDLDDAVDYCQRALALQQELGDRYGQAETWDSLGYAHHKLGRHAQAITCYQTAAELYRQFDDRYNQADTMASLGDVHAVVGDLPSARATWQHALGILELIDHPDAEAVRSRLDRARPPAVDTSPVDVHC